MNKVLMTIMVLLLIIEAKSQQVNHNDYDKDILKLNQQVKLIQSENNQLKKLILANSNKLIAINSDLDSTKYYLSQSKKELNEKLNKTIYSNDNSFKKVDTSLNNKTIIGVIAVLLAILLSLSFYIILNKRQKHNNSDLINELNNTKVSIENKLVKEFEKQTGLLEIKVNNIPNINNIIDIESKTVDHSLALKVASEINLIERNIKLMDNKTKGLKQIQQSIIKLKDNLAVNGYEIPVLLDKPYNQGMRVIVTSSIPDENLSKGEEIISKIIIPQVNFNDKMIQTAQIEVSVGY